MVTEPLVSIIIPVFNAEKFLSQSIESAINQTWRNVEIIIVDDGSTDQSVQVAKMYANNKVLLVQQENRGASAARNTGISHSNGVFFQFLDADDMLSKDKIAEQLS
ncbi:MAG: glycosyltransferase, partial [Sphingobacteriales bacterium]